jgi:high-affinity iron transporter
VKGATCVGSVMRVLTVAGLAGASLVGSSVSARADAQVSGVVRMPDVCSPAVSPAVVYLTRAGAGAKALDRLPIRPSAEAARGVANSSEGAAVSATVPTPRDPSASISLVNQRGLQFVPRVQAVAVGGTVRFGNLDGETHNVHVITSGFAFNQSMAPGQFQDFSPTRSGVMKLACDIHHHMRGFVLVSPTPWVCVCVRDGRFRLEGVPDGRYVLTAWHEMGDAVTTEIQVQAGQNIDLPPIVVTARLESSGVAVAAGVGGSTPPSGQPWPEVIDRIGMALAASRDAASRPGELAKARRLADDAYWVEFEASDLETAVRKFLGYARAGELERQFRAIRTHVRDVSEKRQPASVLDDACHRLLLDLLAVARELDGKGVTDRTRIDSRLGGALSLAGPGATTWASNDDPRGLLQELKRGFRRVAEEADANGSDAAASELTTVYMTDFEPIERYLLGREPQSIRPLEIQFNTMRGELSAGLKGEGLATQLDDLALRVETLINGLEARPTGAFGPAFAASLVTIVREGVEVILILTMLLALVAKAASAPAAAGADGLADRGRRRGVVAIWQGTAGAALASVLTAIGLNTMVASAQGRAREFLEGAVMLAAAAVLFYVSYWLISHSQAKRWMDFLKSQAQRGLKLGGQWTLAVTAFLAVYREGAETALMYQALLGSEGRTRAGLLGVAAGLAVGFVLLAVIALVIRATSVKLPMRLFFKCSGIFLFGLAVVFAGNGVFELQNAGILITTNLRWMGGGLPWAGLYPNLQVVSIQGLLVASAVLAWVADPLLSQGARRPVPA